MASSNRRRFVIQNGGPITIGYGHYAPGQSLAETMAVDDAMIILEGWLSVSTDAVTVSTGPGDIVHMSKSEAVTIRTHEEGALNAYVTYPHWQPAHASLVPPSPITFSKRIGRPPMLHRKRPILHGNPHFSDKASPLKSRLTITPFCSPLSSKMAPFWFVRTTTCAPLPRAAPAPP